MRAGVIGLAPGEDKERDLSWQDWTVPFDMFADGKMFLFTESGEAGGGEYAVFTRESSGTPAVRLGQGSARALSPDGMWALVLRQNASPPDFILLPTGVGQQRVLPTPGIVPNHGQFFSDSQHILFDGHQLGRGPQLFVTDLNGGKPRAITPEGFRLAAHHQISPDGKLVASVTTEGIALISIDGGQPQHVRGSQPGDEPLWWGSDGMLLVGRRSDVACEVSRLDVRAGARTTWKSFSPPDLAGIVRTACPCFAADEQHYVFGYGRNLSDLFLVEHLK